MGIHVLHHSTVRTQFFEKLKHKVLDTLIAVGHYASDKDYNNHVELFTLSSSKWRIKRDYPYSMDIHWYSILAVEKKFIIFGGKSYIRKLLTNQDIKIRKTIRKYHNN